jgi:hypothetical protein
MRMFLARVVGSLDGGLKVEDIHIVADNDLIVGIEAVEAEGGHSDGQALELADQPAVLEDQAEEPDHRFRHAALAGKPLAHGPVVDADQLGRTVGGELEAIERVADLVGRDGHRSASPEDGEKLGEADDHPE